MMRRSVVLPEPDGPSSASRLPDGASTLTWSSATNEPNRLLTSFTRMLMSTPKTPNHQIPIIKFQVRGPAAYEHQDVWPLEFGHWNLEFECSPRSSATLAAS